MHQAIPYRTWTQTPATKPIKNSTDVRKLAMETPLIAFGKRGCCIFHVMKTLFQTLGVLNPSVYEVDEFEESELIRQLLSVVDLNQKSGNDETMMMMTLPVVFVGGQLFGGLDRMIATHISDELVPALKRAGAL